MLQEYLARLCGELKIEPARLLKEKKCYSFRLRRDIEVELRDLNPGIAIFAKIVACPNKRREDLFIYLMRANLLGQGTGHTRIGLDENEKVLTLSSGLPYEINYQAFKETLEDFINYLIYWREEVVKFEKEQQSIL